MNVQNIVGTVLIATIMLSLSIVTGMVILGGGNDYGIQPLYDAVVSLNSSGIVGEEVVTGAEQGNQSIINNIAYLDKFWLLSFFVILASSIYVAYFAERSGVFSFVNATYIGSLVLLFILEIYYQVNVWIFDEVVLNLLPTAQVSFPFFSYYIQNMGLITAIHIFLLIFVNIIDLDLFRSLIRKKTEEELIKSDEVL